MGQGQPLYWIKRSPVFFARPYSHSSAAASPYQADSCRGSCRPRTIQSRQHASVTAAEPAIAVARDPVIDGVADRPWDEVEDPGPAPAGKRARDAQHGFGFHIAVAGRQERKRLRAVRIDPELLGEGTSLGQLHWNEAKIAAGITVAAQAPAARP